jgi:hypothetical protein
VCGCITPWQGASSRHAAGSLVKGKLLIWSGRSRKSVVTARHATARRFFMERRAVFVSLVNDARVYTPESSAPNQPQYRVRHSGRFFASWHTLMSLTGADGSRAAEYIRQRAAGLGASEEDAASLASMAVFQDERGKLYVGVPVHQKGAAPTVAFVRLRAAPAMAAKATTSAEGDWLRLEARSHAATASIRAVTKACCVQDITVSVGAPATSMLSTAAKVAAASAIERSELKDASVDPQVLNPSLGPSAAAPDDWDRHSVLVGVERFANQIRGPAADAEAIVCAIERVDQLHSALSRTAAVRELRGMFWRLSCAYVQCENHLT